MLEVKNLSFQYKKEEVLSDLNFSLESGKITVLLGPNGTGKSTLINLLAGLLKCKHGSISYDGKELQKLSYRQRAKIVGYVSQKIHSTSLTVYDTILLGRIHDFGQNESKEDSEIVEEIIHELHLETHAMNFPEANCNW